MAKQAIQHGSSASLSPSTDSFVERGRLRVGLIGVGLMGTALAERLTSGGVEVLGYDTDASRHRPLLLLGGRPACNAQEVFICCDRVLLSLPTSEDVREVLAEVEAHLRPGQLLIDATTGIPADAALFGQLLATRGVDYLDATISGSSTQVGGAETVVLAGGSIAAFERGLDLFRLFARKSFHVGPCGSGSLMKLVVNLVLGVNRAALAEGLVFARAVGLDPASVLVVLKESAAYSRIMDHKGDKMLQGDFAPQAKLSQHLKDVRIILDEAGSAGVFLPLSQAHRGLLEVAETAGLGAMDNSAIIQAFSLLGNGKAGK